MRILDKARDAFGDAAQVVSRETEVMALRAKVAKLEGELQLQLLAAGKAALEVWKQGGCKDPKTEPVLKKAAEIEVKITQALSAAAAVKPAPKPAAKPAAKPVADAKAKPAAPKKGK
jgi:hypothetical protein